MSTKLSTKLSSSQSSTSLTISHIPIVTQTDKTKIQKTLHFHKKHKRSASTAKNK